MSNIYIEMKLLSTFRNSKGFTLIELLVVIGILGILAAALIATIDPFEQLKKADDSNRKNTAVEMVNASIRYYTTHSAMPWDAAADGGVDCLTGVADPSGVQVSVLGTCITTYINEGELKSSFSESNILSSLYLTESDNDMFVCFRPDSKSGRRDALTKYTQTGGDVTDPTTNCEGYGGATQCYWCAR